MESKGTVLLIEDNAELNISNSRALRQLGYTVLTAETLAKAREQMRKQEPDIILLDVMLPDGNGFDFCVEIRERVSAHILFLTAKTEHDDMVRGLMSGGDDYIAKPFHPEELLARVEAAIRRRGMNKVQARLVTKGALTLDIVASQAYMDGKDLLLSQKEFAILLLLIQNEGETMSNEYIYESVWGQPMGLDSSALHSAVYRLRKKLEGTGYDFATTRRRGYAFVKS